MVFLEWQLNIPSSSRIQVLGVDDKALGSELTPGRCNGAWGLAEMGFRKSGRGASPVFCKSICAFLASMNLPTGA